MELTFVRKDPHKGYFGRQLWIPKKHVNTISVKAGLEFPVPDEEYGIKFLQLWEDSSDHLIVPREFIPRDQYPLLDFPIVSVQPKTFPHVGFKSKVILDHVKPAEDVQRRAFADMLAAKSGILNLSCGKGKGQPLDEIVYTPTGPRCIGDIQKGDFVLGADGKPTCVLGVFPQGERNVYSVTFSDGTSVRCDDDHLWRVRVANHKWRVIPLKIIRKKLRNAAGLMYAIPYCKPTQFDQTHKLRIDPWLLGAYLGDGSSTGNPKFHNPEADLQKRFCSALPTGDVGKVTHLTDRCSEVRVTGGNLTAALSDYQLKHKRSWEKFIPTDYLRANEQNRWELLQGLLDTDGSVSGRTIEYSTSSKQLAEDVAELVRSLGGRASIRSRKPTYTYQESTLTGRKSYRVRILFPSGGATPVSSSKHVARWKDTTGQRKYRYIAKIRFLEKAPTVCIKVAAEDECYLTRNFTVTHNTVIALHHIAHRHVPAIIIVNNTTLINQWQERIEQFLEVEGGVGVVQGPPRTWDWEGRGIVLAMLHSLSLRYDELPVGFDRYFGGIYFDEVHHLAAPLFSRAAPLFYGERYGLTATVSREDGLEPVYQYHLGSVFHRNLMQELQPRIYFQESPLKMNLLDPEVKKKVFDARGMINIPKLRTYLGASEENNAFIAEKIGEPLKVGRKILVLSHSVAQLRLLADMFPDSGVCTGEEDPADRIETLKHRQVTFGTLQLVREALDEQTLDTLFFLTPFGSGSVDNGGKNTLQQGMGRILRHREGKKTPVVVIIDHVYIQKFHKMCRKLKQLMHEWPRDEGGPYEYTLLKPYEHGPKEKHV